MTSVLPNEGNFSVETITIPKSCLNYFNENILPFKDTLNKKYSIALTGQIGVGKSTLCQALKLLFDIPEFKLNPIREYINYDEDGPRMLIKFLSKKITNPTFQNYIMDSYITQCKQKDDWLIRIIERPVVDSVACFGVLSHVQQKDFTTLQLNALFDRCVICCDDYDLPSYDGGKDTKFLRVSSINFENALKTVLKTIYFDLSNGISKRMIGLDIDGNSIREFYEKTDLPNEIKEYVSILSDGTLIVCDIIEELKKLKEFSDPYDQEILNLIHGRINLVINNIKSKEYVLNFLQQILNHDLLVIESVVKKYTGRLNAYDLMKKSPDLKLEMAFIIARINQRNRDCEKSYDVPYLLNIHQYYKDIYNNAEEEEPIVYSDLFVESARMRKIVGSPY